MDVQSLGFRTDLAVGRRFGATVTDRGDHLVIRTEANPGFWWGNYLLVPPLGPGDQERWTAAFAAEFPDAAHLALGVDGRDGTVGAVTGLAVDVSTVLTATGLPAPDPGVEIRVLTTDEDWQGYVAVDEACFGDRPTPPVREFNERQNAATRAVTRTGAAAWLGAVVDGTVRATLGIVAAGEGLARYRNVETHPEYRRRGLARALVCAAGRYAGEHLDARRLVIVADPDYHAIELYRSLGFLDTERQVQLTRPVPEDAQPPADQG